MPTEQPFRALEVNVQLGELHLAFVRGSRHAIHRTAAVVDDQPADAIAIYAALRGEVVLEQAGRRHVLRPGHLLVCDADQPFARTFARGLEELAVKLPRSNFEAATGLSSVPAPVVLDTRDSSKAIARALVRIVGQAVRPKDAVPADEAAVLDLASALAAGERGPRSLAHRSTAKAFIEEHLTDPGLGAVEVAAAAGISDRTLSRVFAEAGTSVPRYILARRLDLAYSLLAGGDAARLRTVDVAARCGFNSRAYFSQSFERRFGVAAGEVRRAHS
ncbi:helix-turn-helix domain-containing protein [Sphaerimonospora thailandensis]|uniref:HTH araC/xylS-type domain-containing protein n=1 Tax=Sphaerimonospora thailandensis TaxID=795644 RepID=A0A8J3RBH6_9ACTN|nr:hypothetical protein Mth01_42310 [Sphaerimonospora thailandensis]